MMQALEAEHLGKRYGRTWALRDCDLEIPAGCVTGLVGLNGAGKTTLLHLAMGLLMPTSGSVKVLGSHPGKDAERVLAKVGFIAQDRPLYKSFRVEEMVTLGRKLNRTWDQELARLFQGIESGIYLFFAAILIALTYGWTKYGIIGRERSIHPDKSPA